MMIAKITQLSREVFVVPRPAGQVFIGGNKTQGGMARVWAELADIYLAFAVSRAERPLIACIHSEDRRKC